MHQPDLSAYSYPELITLRDAVNARIAELQQQGLAELAKKFETEAALYGLTAAAILNGSPRKRGRTKTKATNSENEDADHA